MSGERQGVSNCKHGEVNINFGCVDCLATVVGVHLLGRDTLVVELGSFPDVEAVRFAGESLQERRATRTWRTENHKHFTTLDQTFKIPEDINASRLRKPKRGLDGINSLQQDIGYVGLVISRIAKTMHIEVAAVSYTHLTLPTKRIV